MCYVSSYSHRDYYTIYSQNNSGKHLGPSSTFLREKYSTDLDIAFLPAATTGHPVKTVAVTNRFIMPMS